MNSKLQSFLPSLTGVAAAIAGGIASVLLAMLTMQHPPATLAMGFVAPLPLMIASLAFGSAAGGLAVLTGAVFVALFDMKLGHLVLAQSDSFAAASVDALVYFVGLGLPAWLLSIATQLPAKPFRGGVPPMRPDEMRLSRVVLVAIVFAIISVALVFGVAIIANGGLAAFDKLMVESFEAIWQKIGETRDLPKSIDPHAFAVQLAAVLPPLMSAMAVLFYAVNLWIAARIARTSGMFAKDWPDIPRNLRLPRVVALLLAVALGLSFLGGLLGLAARLVSAALVAGLALQGLAVIHALTRGKTYRTALLVLVYLGVFALMPWPLVAWGFFGLLDLAFSFRDRQTPTVIRQTERKDPWK